MIVDAIRKIAQRKDLSRDEARAAMQTIMEGAATSAQIAAFITALRLKGETVDEITGCALAMREKSVRIEAGASKYDVVDTCGTGGDARNTFNISTAAAFVTAGAGVKVAKHGNRSVSSKSGSADVLKALGVNIEANPETVARCLQKAGIGFLFAPLLHPAMKHALGPRREIGIRTVFNVLGPLTNPAGARCQVLGVYECELVQLLAGVLAELGSRRSYVVHGRDGLDEITICESTRIAELRDGRVRVYDWTPESLGIKRRRLDELAVGSPEDSAEVIRGILGGQAGAARDIVLVNAAAAIAASGAAADIEGGLALATQAVDSGAAAKTLRRLVEESNN